jgi:hypothetical protein
VRTYKTQSGTYTEDQLGIVVWMNPKNKESHQSRFLETMTAENSTLPMAFPLSTLTKDRNWQNASLVRSKDEVFELIRSSERSKPLIIPLPIAKAALGWEDFYIPTEYTN